MMPLNLFIYSRSWTTEGAVIPYSNIAIALALILVPVLIGMIIKYKKPSWCPIITKVRLRERYNIGKYQIMKLNNYFLKTYLV